MIWRDTWEPGVMPQVVVLAEQGPQGGVIYDAALYLFGETPSPVTLLDPGGEPLTLILPEPNDGPSMVHQLDLEVAESATPPQQENPQ